MVFSLYNNEICRWSLALFFLASTCSATGDDPPPSRLDKVIVVVDPVPSALRGTDKLLTVKFDFHGKLMDVARGLDESKNWITDSVHELEFTNRAMGVSNATRVATRVLRNSDADAAVLLDFVVFTSPDHRQVRLVTRLAVFTIRYGRHSAIEKTTRRYEYLSPASDVLFGRDSDAALTTAIDSMGRMIRANLKLLLTTYQYTGDRASFTGLDPAGNRKTYRGRVFYVDGENTVYSVETGDIYSVPTAD